MPKQESPSSASLSGRGSVSTSMTRSGRPLRASYRVRHQELSRDSSSPSPASNGERPFSSKTAGLLDAAVNTGMPATLDRGDSAPQNEPQPALKIPEDVAASLRSALARATKSLERQKKTSRKAKESAAEAKQELEEVREEMEQLTARLERAERDSQQYRNWWLNEVQFTKVILNKVPNANRDWDLVRTSQSHYLGRF
ncbi:hypothetical protein BKA70DRAFT_1231522 [Coprinopsis sp. MPI-PUGE-AT-0042]|nr:hypothetical protein BKA70DRAFT_1231522 [Coprinopsis sp. MPI-PUGE-AT-0042]